MQTSDLKYLLAYTIPVLGFLCAVYPEQFYYLTPLFAFVLLPFLEYVSQPKKENHDSSIEKKRSSNFFFDILLYINFPIIYIVVFLGIINLISTPLHITQIILSLFSFGIVLGTSGINVAHEIGHRNNVLDQWVSKLMLLLSMYMHFNIEHNLGHHKHVATPIDPATARRGEWVYSFWFKSILGGYKHAWVIENKRVSSKHNSSFHFSNQMFLFHIMQFGMLISIFLLLGPIGLIYYLVIALISILLLETINYIEHYGLQRKLLPNGRYETVQPYHSWNSDHIMGRIMLYELTRHSDHHYKANRKFQILRSIKESPQLPLGYPGSVVLALFPPLWCKLMEARLS